MNLLMAFRDGYVEVNGLKHHIRKLKAVAIVDKPQTKIPHVSVSAPSVQ